MKIYVASSWKNIYQSEVVGVLRADGHDVYDFKNTDHGFNWKEIDGDYKKWSPSQYRDALDHPLAQAAFAADMAPLKTADLCVLVMPSGRSAAFEYGFWRGMTNRHGILYIPFGEVFEPELMFAGAEIVDSLVNLMLATRAKQKEINPVHILYGLLPLCGFTNEFPAAWPSGHRWVSSADDMSRATCSRCIAAGKAQFGDV